MTLLHDAATVYHPGVADLLTLAEAGDQLGGEPVGPASVETRRVTYPGAPRQMWSALEVAAADGRIESDTPERLVALVKEWLTIVAP